MTFADNADLAQDTEFAARLAACLTLEAVPKVDDRIADQILRSPGFGASMFMPWISSAPGFGDKYATGGQESIADGEILSAVQASWGAVANVYTPAELAPV